MDENRGRPRARHVRVLPENTVSFVQKLGVRRGVVISAAKANRDLAEESKRRCVTSGDLVCANRVCARPCGHGNV